MKRALLSTLIFLFCIALNPVDAMAHPPKEPTVVWNASTQMLTVTSHHTVSNSTKHYVMALVVLNSKGEAISTKQYTSQSNPENFSDAVQLKGVLPGDKVTVRLVCNIMGTVEKTVFLK